MATATGQNAGSSTDAGAGNAAAASGQAAAAGAAQNDATAQSGATSNTGQAASGAAQASADGQAAGTGQQDAGQAQQRVVPDKYTLNAPEGYGAEEIASFERLAKANQLTQDEAQFVLDQMPNAYAVEKARFVDTLKSHQEVGGERMTQAKELAMKALDKYLPSSEPDGARLRRDLSFTGYDHYAPLLVLLSRIGKDLSEDGATHGSGRSSSSGEVNVAELFYGKAS